MPAAPPGTTTMTLTDGTGATTVQVVIHYNPTTFAFDVDPAVTVINNTSKHQNIAFTDENGTTTNFNVPSGTTNATPAQVEQQTGVTALNQLEGISVSLG